MPHPTTGSSFNYLDPYASHVQGSRFDRANTQSQQTLSFYKNRFVANLTGLAIFLNQYSEGKSPTINACDITALAEKFLSSYPLENHSKFYESLHDNFETLQDKLNDYSIPSLKKLTIAIDIWNNILRTPGNALKHFSKAAEEFHKTENLAENISSLMHFLNTPPIIDGGGRLVSKNEAKDLTNTLENVYSYKKAQNFNYECATFESASCRLFFHHGLKFFNEINKLVLQTDISLKEKYEIVALLWSNLAKDPVQAVSHLADAHMALKCAQRSFDGEINKGIEILRKQACEEFIEINFSSPKSTLSEHSNATINSAKFQKFFEYSRITEITEDAQLQAFQQIHFPQGKIFSRLGNFVQDKMTIENLSKIFSTNILNSIQYKFVNSQPSFKANNAYYPSSTYFHISPEELKELANRYGVKAIDWIKAFAKQAESLDTPEKKVAVLANIIGESLAF